MKISDNSNAAKILLENGADKNITNNKGQTCFDLAKEKSTIDFKNINQLERTTIFTSKSFVSFFLSDHRNIVDLLSQQG